jgi:hypothetical protein
MELISCTRALHRMLCAGHDTVIVHMNRENEEYTGTPTGVFAKTNTQARIPQRGDRGDAAIGSRVPDPKNSAMRRNQDAHRPISWRAHDFILGFTIIERSKEVTIYLPIDEVIAITGVPNAQG